MTNELYLLETRWACGGIAVSGGVIITAAPIFKKLLGARLDSITKRYKVTRINPLEIPDVVGNLPFEVYL